MKKLILSLILVFGILFGGSVSAKYDLHGIIILDDTIKELKIKKADNGKIFGYSPYNPKLGKGFINYDFRQYDLFENKFKKYGILKNKCQYISYYYENINENEVYFSCGAGEGSKKEWSIYVNGVKIDGSSEGSDYFGEGVVNMEKINDILIVDHLAAAGVGVGYRRYYKNIKTKKEYLVKIILLKNKLLKSKYNKILKSFEKNIDNFNNDKLLEINSKIGRISDKIRNNKKYKDILDYLEAKVKLEILKREI